MGDAKPRIRLAGHDPWEQQDGESESMFQRYRLYQNMGAGRRTVRRVAAEAGKSTAYMHRVAWRNRWTERAAAWDREQERAFLELLEDERRRMVEDHLRLSKGMLAKLAVRLQNLDPSELSPADIARWAEVLTKIRANVLGLPETPTTAAAAGGASVSRVPGSDDERREELEDARARLLAVLDGDVEDLDPAELYDAPEVEPEEL